MTSMLASMRNPAMPMSAVLARLGLAAALLAVATPGNTQSSSGPVLPYDAAVARVKKAADKGIFHGQRTPKGAYPFVVALIQADATDDEQGNYGGQYCAGTLVGDRWVLTGAQCVLVEDEEKRKVAIAPDKVDIYAGSNDFRDGKRVRVKRVIVHPQFEHDSYNNDVALLELAESAASNKTAIIALATPQNESALAGVGKKVITAGWGETETKELPQELRHVEMDVLDSAMCNTNIINLRKANFLEAWAKMTQVHFALNEGVAQEVRTLVASNAGKVVNDNMICSGRARTKRDTCKGDEGGPLFAKGADGKFVLVGITSWGEGCGQGDKGLYGIYTRASRYAGWVQENAK
jgi:secreted trypsin-like serine protease